MNYQEATQYLKKAHKIKVSDRLLRREVSRGRLNCIPLGHRTIRFKPFQLDRWVEKRTVNV